LPIPAKVAATCPYVEVGVGLLLRGSRQRTKALISAARTRAMQPRLVLKRTL
jgi:hypothetical protein